MDTSRLERFAKYARRYLMEQVEIKLIQILVYTDGKASEQRRVYPAQVHTLEDEIYRTCHIKIAEGTAKIDTKPMQELIERVAYTWFNRFCALRFMDVNGYNKVNVVSPLAGHFQPEILEDAKAGHIDEKLVQSKYRTKVFDLLSGKETHPDPQSEAYRILVRSVCNYYADTMPFLFERIEDWTELLMPDDLLSGNSILAYTREAMVPGVCKDVEVIGWLYQFYIAEKKEAAQAGIKKGKKIQSDEQAAVTQLFTPHWIVKYMVQNSLGRLWLQSHPKSSIQDKMEFYVNNPQDDKNGLDSRLRGNDNMGITIKSPEEIKLCDPCCGSGHVLTYAFDLLFEIYSEMGYDPSKIPRLIIENNLYGIEIDERAAGLAAFALTMKARSKDRTWFSSDNLVKPQICKLENISFAADEIDPYMDRCGRDIFTLPFERMLSQFEHADTFGSLIVPYEQDIEVISDTLNARDFSGDVFLAPTHKKVLQLLKQADYLSTKYQVVVTNPPYLGTSGFGKEKEDWFKTHYPNSRSDFFAMFMERCLSLSLDKGIMAMINMQSWMFLSSYEKLRKYLVEQFEITTMAHLGPRAFDSIGGEVVSTTAFTVSKALPSTAKGAYFRLIDGRSETGKMEMYLQAVANPGCGYFFRIASSEFKKIPGAPIAYWASSNFVKAFGQNYVMDELDIKSGLLTGNDSLFLRAWFEVPYCDIPFNYQGASQIEMLNPKWLPVTAGGEFRKWYGNLHNVVNSHNGFKAIKSLTDNNYRLRNDRLYFRKGVNWPMISSVNFGAKLSPHNVILGNGVRTGFVKHSDNSSEEFFISYLSSKVAYCFLKIINPTLNFNNENIDVIPLIYDNDLKVHHNGLENVQLSRDDWDSYETSWDFQQLPLIGVRNGEAVKPNTQNLKPKLSEAYAKLREQWIESTLKMQELEEENNRIFIEAYGLQEELKPDVPLKEITLTCNPYYRYGTEAVLPSSDATNGSCISEVNPTSDEGIEQAIKQFPLNQNLENRLCADTMKEFISYSVGCMFGRYSLDKPGLILANQGETLADYLRLIPDPSFLPDKDNVIPILDGEWFDDDIVNRFYIFLKAAFGEENFSQNLGYIEEAIGKDIRNYFLKDFYNDHVKRYKKRPIYWLFSSPSCSFNALIYMHRYSADTASIILNNYLREYGFKLKNRTEELRKREISGDSTQKEKIFARKELDRTEKIISELEYWERDALYPAATQKISIDLDDGVKVNYARFSKVLKRIPGLG